MLVHEPAVNHHHHGHERGHRQLTLALIITAAYCLVEFVGGLLTNSLALLADAGHMLGDVAALGAGAFAIRLAQRPPTASKTFGYHRIEILTAFVSGLILWLIAGLIFHEAYQRFFQPPLVKSAGMIVIAVLGLAVNLVSLWVLRHSQATSLNVRAAFVHVLGDALGSVGAIGAGGAILLWNWYAADPLVSIGIGVLILYTSWGIVRESADILMQGTPRELRLEDIERCLLAIDGVRQVHDLHVWTLTSGRYLLSVHLVAARADETRPIIDAAQLELRERFGIGHTTVQVDPEDECTEEFRAH